MRRILWGVNILKFRNILLVLMSMLFIAGAYITFYNSNITYLIDSLNKDHNIDENFMPFNLPENINSDKQSVETLKILNKTSDSLGINYAKLQIYDGYLVNERNEVDYERPQTKVNYQLYTVKPSRVQEYFENKSNEDTKNYARDIRSLGYSVTLSSINNDISYNGRQGYFYIETVDQKMYDNYLIQLTNNYNTRFNSNYKPTDFKRDNNSPKNTVVIESIDGLQLDSLRTTLFIIILIFVVLYILLSNRYIATYRLMGYSSSQIVHDLFGYVACITSFGGVLVGMYVIFVKKWVVSIQSAMFLLAFLILVGVIALITIMIMNKLSFNAQLKNKNYLKGAFYILYGIKAVALIMVFGNLIPIYQLVSSQTEMITTNYQDKKIGNEYGILGPRALGFDSDDDMGFMKMNEHIDKNLYQKLNAKGAILFDGRDVDHPETISENYQKLNKVNPNYLKRFPIKDIDGKEISINNFEEKLILVLPLNMQSKVVNITDYLITSESEEMGRPINVKTIWVSDNTHYFDLNNGYYRPMIPMLVSTISNSSIANRNILTGTGKDDALKIPIDKNEANTYMKLLKDLEITNIADNYTHIVKLNDIEYDEVKFSVGNIKIAIISIAITGIFMMLMSMYLITLYFRANVKSIYYKFMSGYGWASILSPLIYLFISQYIFMFFVLYLNQGLDKMYIIGLITLFIIEVIFMCPTMNVLRKNVSKGSQ